MADNHKFKVGAMSECGGPTVCNQCKEVQRILSSQQEGDDE